MSNVISLHQRVLKRHIQQETAKLAALMNGEIYTEVFQMACKLIAQGYEANVIYALLQDERE
jgi:hypothetical protein